ncbi:MAG: hypothetical protein AAGC55_19745, partial [Myxococcota bacterium]
MKPHILLVLSVLGLAALPSCSGGGATGKPHIAQPGYDPGTRAPSPAAHSAQDAAEAAYERGNDSYHARSSTAAGTARPHRDEPRTERRPGLGTVFGETMHSQVDTRPFTRAAAHPFAAVAIYYNDAEGSRAHAGYLGSSSLAPIRAHTPHGGISVELLDSHGNLLPGGAAGGKTFVVGRNGQRYSIVLHNHTGGRYEIVASVDGLDVIDGRPADLDKR